MKTSNCNIYKDATYSVYCGRGSGQKNNPENCLIGEKGWLGNPVAKNESCIICNEKHLDNGSTLICYRKFLNKKLESDDAFKKAFFELKGKKLGCFCKPNPCHTDVMINILDNLIFYAGIGSRETPDDVLVIMTELAKVFSQKGIVLRSGGAEGADTAFAQGSNNLNEIFYSWDCNPQAMSVAESIIPHWKNCSDVARKLHGRNIFQILGRDLQTPSSFVVCWTKNGKEIGGTRTAIICAKNNNIPVFNLGDKKAIDGLILFVKEKYQITL